MDVSHHFGAFEISREIGRGGMARVFLARHRSGGPERVLKVMEAEVDKPDIARALFRREASIGEMFTHPNVVKVHGLVEHEGRLALIMEYLEGQTLRQLSRRAWLGGRSLPMEALVQAMIECALALHAAHHLEHQGRPNALVHRDVSADNIVVTTSGVTKLIDFGVAKPDRGTFAISLKGEVRGKPTYMAPERLMATEADGRSDLWSLGVVFYLLLTGRRPFRGEGVHDLVRMVLTEEPPSPRSINPRVPESIERIVWGLLRKNPDERTSTGVELASQLRAAVADLPPEYLPPARLLLTADEAERDPCEEPLEFAALPSLDWDAGVRRQGVEYEATRVVDPTQHGVTYGGMSARAPIVGACSLPDSADHGNDSDSAEAVFSEPTLRESTNAGAGHDSAADTVVGGSWVTAPRAALDLPPPADRDEGEDVFTTAKGKFVDVKALKRGHAHELDAAEAPTIPYLPRGDDDG